MPSTRLLAIFIAPILSFFLFVNSVPLEQIFEEGNESDTDNFYAKLCSGVFDNESLQERVVDLTFQCQSIFLVRTFKSRVVFQSKHFQPDKMRRCVLDEFNITTYPWNVSIAKSIVCHEPDGCTKFNRSSICVQNEAEKVERRSTQQFHIQFHGTFLILLYVY